MSRSQHDGQHGAWPRDPSLIPRLRQELEERLVVLDRERAAVKAALAALAPRPRRLATRGSEESDLNKRIQRAVKANPGIRASMLATIENLPGADVVERLEAMATGGRVEKDGLGWRFVS